MVLHLNERGNVVSLAADFVEIMDRGNSLLGVFEFGGNPESCATNKLIMLHKDDAS
jgi:hypothetical protein